jgi:hypothetical protein
MYGGKFGVTAQQQKEKQFVHPNLLYPSIRRCL